MHTQVSQHYKRGDRIADIATNIFRAAFITTILTGIPFSIGGAKDATAESAQGPTEHANRPTCAELGARATAQSPVFGPTVSAQRTDRTAKSRLNVGCGVGDQLAESTPVSN